MIMGKDVDNNVEYYNKNADSFFAGSVNADMAEDREAFLAYVPDGGKILDAGCGSGRDSKAFLDAGYDIVAFDASREMRIRASEYIGREVLDLRFEDISFEKELDGIWASASLLHVPVEELPEVMGRMRKALKRMAETAGFELDLSTAKNERYDTERKSEHEILEKIFLLCQAVLLILMRLIIFGNLYRKNIYMLL